MNEKYAFQHETVLLHETVAMMNLRPGHIVVDCTAGGGGHCCAILEQITPGGTLYALDRDLNAIHHLQNRFKLQQENHEMMIEHSNFSSLDEVVARFGLAGHINAICADLGVSSHHLDIAERGFSFMKDGPLDMRMDQSSGPSAADLVNQASEQELSDIIFRFGEEPKARFIARAIVALRQHSPLVTTAALAELVEKTVHYRKPSRKHPATKTFQALRIAVNDELTAVTTLIDKAFAALVPGGRLAIITFHSLEDRIVKRRFAELAGKSRHQADQRALRHLPISQQEWMKSVKANLIKPYPTYPSDQEVKQNPRARSAKLRVLEKR